MNNEEKFRKIILDAIAKADAIDCAPEDYRSSLRNWIEEIQVCISASEESET